MEMNFATIYSQQYGIIDFMRVKRRHVARKNLSDPEDNYVNTSPSERILIIWELTAELWSLADPENAQRRLQRNVVHLARQWG